MVDLCRAVAKHLADQRSLPSLNVVYVPVTATDRFEAISGQRTDLLCEPTSATLSRRELVDFSIPTFLDGAGLMVRADGPKNLRDLAGKKIGVLAGTTTEEALRNTLKEAGIAGDDVAAKTHDEGLAMLDDGKISAYFGDRSIPLFLIKQSKAPDKLRLADDYLSVEPCALALPRGDSDFLKLAGLAKRVFLDQKYRRQPDIMVTESLIELGWAAASGQAEPYRSVLPNMRPMQTRSAISTGIPPVRHPERAGLR